MPNAEMAPLLCSVRDAADALGIGITKTYELIAGNQLETISLGARRLVKMSSVRRLAGVSHEPEGASA